jgi:hypothetical protein
LPAAVAANLREFLADQRPEARIQQIIQDLHMDSCILRILRQAIRKKKAPIPPIASTFDHMAGHPPPVSKSVAHDLDVVGGPDD